MQKLDAIVAATGAVVLVVAIAGAAFYGGSAATETFQIVYAAKSVDLEAESGSAVGEGLTASFNITNLNITKVTVTVTFTGGAARLAEAPLIVQVTGPGGLAGEGEGVLAQGPATQATITVEVNVTAMPANHAYEASSAQAAEEHARTLSTTTGTGEWTVLARATPAVPPNEAVTAEVAIGLSTFEASVSRDAPATR